jgi:peptide chain release factor 3
MTAGSAVHYPIGGRSEGAWRRVRSDWMAVEREGGISVSSAVMSFAHEGLAFNLLDMPGHPSFGPLDSTEYTYRFRLRALINHAFAIIA